MAKFPETGSSDGTWGDELRAFFAPFFDLNTGDANIDGLITDGSVSGTKITDNTITSAKLLDGSVVEAKIGTGAVTEDKIGSLAVTVGKIGAGAVTETKLGTGAVTEDKIGSLAVTSGKIGAGAVTDAKLATDSVTTVKILNSAVTGAKLADATITGDKIADDTIGLENLNFSIPSTIVDVTYSTLVGLISTSELNVGQKYRITDFRTRHVIYGTTDVVGSSATGDLYNSESDPLIVTALTSNTLLDIASSELYPQDIIYYKIDGTPYDSYSDRGCITRRIDTLLNLDIAYDFRNVMFRRWFDPITGDYIILTDNAELFQDNKTFHSVVGYSENNTLNVKIGPCNGRFLSNNVFNWSEAGTAREINLQGDCTDNTFMDHCHNVNFPGGCSQNTFFACDGVIVGAYFYNNYFYGDNATLTASINVKNNIFNTNVNWCDFGGNVRYIISNYSLQNCTISGIQNVTILSSLTNKHIGVDYSEAEGDMDWDSSIDMTTAQWSGGGPSDISYVGIVNLHGEGGTLSTSSITNFPSHPITFIASIGYTFTFTATNYASINADGQILAQANIVINGDYQDSATFELVSITNGNGTFNVLKLVKSSIY